MRRALGAFGCDRAVQRRHLDELVSRHRRRVGALLEQGLGGVGLAEERREVERLEPVGRPRLDQCWIGLEQLLHTLGAPDRSRLEEVELTAIRQQLIGVGRAAFVESLEKRRNVRLPRHN